MSTEHVVTELQDRVLHIRFNRPDKKNALTVAMYHAVVAAFRRAEEEAGIRVMLLSGSAGCFTSGNDIMDFLQNPPTGEESPVTQFLAALPELKKPLVAAVNGPAVGVGVTMLLHCDLVYVGRGARLQLPFVNIGVCPEAASSVILPAMMGHPRAAELILLGEPFTAQRAVDVGIANEVLDDSAVLERATARARQLAQQPPEALRTAKALLKRGQLQAMREAMLDEGEKFMRMVRGPEAVEAMTAFVQKRKPDFSRFS